MTYNAFKNVERAEPNNVVPLVGGESGYAKNAKVLAVSGRNVTLALSVSKDVSVSIEGRVAYSCLVAPKVNDVVVCVQNDTGMHVVLAILDRLDDCQDMTIAFPANANLQSASGNVAIMAKDHVSLLAGDSLVCAATKTIHKSQQAVIKYDNTTVQGQQLNAQFKTVHFLSEMINTIAKNALQKFNHYVRRSAESDQVSAAQMDRKVDGLYSVSSKITMMISKKDTKIDGERIHMG